MKETYKIEYKKLQKEYDLKCKNIEFKNPVNPNRLDGRKEMDELNKWFLNRKAKLMKKYNISTQK